MNGGPFKQSAVAFLDVLGFKNLINDAEASPDGLSRLIGLKAVLDAHVRWDNDRLAPSVPEAVKPKYLFISDSIILSAPLQEGDFDGLSVVIAKTIEIALKLLEMGYLLRGGIAVGKVWAEERNIFGSGYIEAYSQETTANHPCVMLTKSAAMHWAASPMGGSTMVLSANNGQIVDVLNTSYVRGAEHYGRIEDAYAQIKSHITTELEKHKNYERAHAKWKWMASFFNDALRRHGVLIEPISLN